MSEEKQNLDPNQGAISISVEIPRDQKECEHRLDMKTDVLGLSVQCSRCNAGFLLTPGSEFKDGHVYLHGTKLI